MNFAGIFGDASMIWYPVSGARGTMSGTIFIRYGYYWTVDYKYGSTDAYALCFAPGLKRIYPQDEMYRLAALAVRCQKE